MCGHVQCKHSTACVQCNSGDLKLVMITETGREVLSLCCVSLEPQRP